MLEKQAASSASDGYDAQKNCDPVAPAGDRSPRQARQLNQLDGDTGNLSYLPGFLAASEASALEQAILTEPAHTDWLTLPKRRLLNLGGVPHPDGMIAETLPPWLDALLEKLRRVGAFPEGMVPDQVLLNRYGPADGIDPHADGPLFEPHVAIVSLQSPAVMQFFEPIAKGGANETEKTARLAASWDELGPAAMTAFLQPGSLFTFSGEAYTRLLHGIAAQSEPEYLDARCVNLVQASPEAAIGDEVRRGTRLSLTLRAVRRVAVPAGEFLTDAQRDEVRRRRDWWARAVSEKAAPRPRLQWPD